MNAILDNQGLKGGLLRTTICHVKQTLNVRPLAAVGSDAEELTALTPNFLLGQENASAPFMTPSERYHDLRKSFKTAQSICPLDIEKMDS